MNTSYFLSILPGAVLLLLSILLYVKRTGDKSAWKKFWASAKELNKTELILNRLGLGFVILGVILHYS